MPCISYSLVKINFALHMELCAVQLSTRSNPDVWALKSKYSTQKNSTSVKTKPKHQMIPIILLTTKLVSSGRSASELLFIYPLLTS